MMRLVCMAAVVIAAWIGRNVVAQEAAVVDPIRARLPADVVAIENAYQSRSVTVREDGKDVAFAYRLLSPPTIEPGVRYPLVVFLHGAGERGTDNLVQLKYLPAWLAAPAMRQKYPCFLIAPQCRPDRRWVDVSWADAESTPQAKEPTTDMAAVIAMIDDVTKREPVDPDRLYLTGLSMGGFGSWDLAARIPDRLAALVVVCGGGDERIAAKIATIPAWVTHGDADTVVLPVRSQTMVKALEAAGGRPQYTEMPGVGHDAWTPTYRNPAIIDWLFSQRKK